MVEDDVEDYASLNWSSQEFTKPTEQEIANEVARLEALEITEKQKDTAYEDDTQRKTFWDRTETDTKDEFAAFLRTYDTDLASARNAIVGLALEVGRLRRKVG